MRSERWSYDDERAEVLTEDGAGPILEYSNGKIKTYDGEGHVMFLGVSGAGKSRRGTIPMTLSFIKNKESGIIVDPKGEIYKNTKDYITRDYDLHVIDFRNPYGDDAEGWNPLHAPYVLWKTKKPENINLAETMIEELAYALYPVKDLKDPYWNESGKSVFLAGVHMLFEIAEEDQVNLANVRRVIMDGDKTESGYRSGGRKTETFLHKFISTRKDLPDIAEKLDCFLENAETTSACIRSSFISGIASLTRGESVSNFLSRDDFCINEIRGDKPMLVYIIIPDETPIYDSVAGIMVSQLMNNYIRLAENEFGGKLPIRVNVVLEELGNVGRSINNLPHLLSAGRSRNIRVELVLQALSQLDEIYGQANSVTIISNCDVKVAFRVSHWDSLEVFSNLCGKKEVMRQGYATHEQLISEAQLAAMETGQALVMISGRVKYITWLPDYTEMNILKPIKMPKKVSRKRRDTQISYFDIVKYLKEYEERNRLQRCMEMIEEN
ncbi:MAG: type IV secretory system conjugative DNA transfer family protein [Lachnospiraceae bacterium]|nr:type IV secretory system conjugative DNA transfer family protein [Lachnospiraceae bacterium]